MTCSPCSGCAEQFNQRVAAKDLRDYRKNGPKQTAVMLIDALVTIGVGQMTLLDIGGGVGAVQHGLLDAGCIRAIAVDASPAYVGAARKEAVRRGLDSRIAFLVDDIVTADVDAADIVTLDRVVCCYADVEALITRSADHALRLYGLVYPRLTRWTRLLFAALNLTLRLRRHSFRAYLHAPCDIDRLIRQCGFAPLSSQETMVWQVALYKRVDGT